MNPFLATQVVGETVEFGTQSLCSHLANLYKGERLKSLAVQALNFKALRVFAGMAWISLDGSHSKTSFAFHNDAQLKEHLAKRRRIIGEHPAGPCPHGCRECYHEFVRPWGETKLPAFAEGLSRHLMQTPEVQKRADSVRPRWVRSSSKLDSIFGISPVKPAAPVWLQSECVKLGASVECPASESQNGEPSEHPEGTPLAVHSERAGGQDLVKEELGEPSSLSSPEVKEELGWAKEELESQPETQPEVKEELESQPETQPAVKGELESQPEVKAQECVPPIIVSDDDTPCAQPARARDAMSQMPLGGQRILAEPDDWADILSMGHDDQSGSAVQAPLLAALDSLESVQSLPAALDSLESVESPPNDQPGAAEEAAAGPSELASANFRPHNFVRALSAFQPSEDPNLSELLLNTSVLDTFADFPVH